MVLGGSELEIALQVEPNIPSPIGHLWTVFSPKAQLEGGLVGSMANRRSGVARWRHDLQEEEHDALTNLVNLLQISLQNASSRWQTAMELLVEQRQGIQQWSY